MASASRVIVMEPSSTPSTNAFSMSLPRSFSVASFPRNPSSTIRSSRLPGAAVSTTVVAAAGAALFFSAIRTSFGLVHFLLQFGELVFVARQVQQHLFQLVVALQLTPQIAQRGP